MMQPSKTTSIADKPRLIEVAFPLEQASVASVHEKNVRHGHISTLHIWPARRPLAASRAALLATLLPDPGNAYDRQKLLDLIGGEIVTKTVTEQDDEGNTVSEQKKTVEGGVLAWGQENDPAIDKLRGQIREFYDGRAPKVLDPFAGGGAIPLEAMRLGCEVTASDLNPVAWFILKCTLDYPQRFAGKKWPLPQFVNDWPDFVEDFLAGKVKKRKPTDRPHFSDPKQYSFSNPPKPLDKDAGGFNFLPDADLSWHVRAWGRWVLERARQDLAGRYPIQNGEPTVAYLWARTARDPRTAGRIPLLKTFWLCRKKGRRTALLPIPQKDGSGVVFKLLREEDLMHPQPVIDENPHLQTWEVTPETLLEFLNLGTMNRAGVWSPCSGRPGVIALRMEDLRRQGQQGLLGLYFTAVVVDSPIGVGSKTIKLYRLPTETELQAAEVQNEDLETAFQGIPFGVPEEPLPPVGTLGFRIPLYGFKKWREVFIPRQLLSLAIFVKHTREATSYLKHHAPYLAEPICAYLAVNLDRLANRASTMCVWSTDANKIEQTFARFAMPMKWDFCESIPTSEVSGGYYGQLEFVAKYIEHALSVASSFSPKVKLKSALKPSGNQDLDAVVTDPPYYDAIPYSDLMDFFYIWLRRTLFGISHEIDLVFAEPLSPKWKHEENDGELIDDQSRFGGNSADSRKSYEDGMTKAFKAGFDKLNSNGRLVIVFANKEVDAWETLVDSLIRGGAVVSASWPIQTEKAGGLRNLHRASLSSSIWIVCRKRSALAQPGWDIDVLERMREILFTPRQAFSGRNILQYYFDLGITGPDFLWAALGPSLEAYSEHPFVKKTEGGIMTATEFLVEVRKLVLQFTLGELPGFHELQAQTQGRGESIELDAVTQYYLLHRASFGLDLTPAGPCIMYAQACGKPVTELKVVWNVIEQGGQSRKGRPRKEADESEEEEQSSGNEFRLRDWEERAADEKLGEPHDGQPAPLIDRLHRLMALFHRNQAPEVQKQYEAWGLASERAFPALLQATRELALRDRQDTERRLIEAIATQLNFTRRQVVDGEVVKDEPFFPAIVSYEKRN
jgi:putative DNA methylase